MYLVWRIGEITFGRATGLLAAALFAFYPNHIFWSSTLYADVYFTMWFALALFIVLRTRDWMGRRALAGWAVLGLVVGFASLTRGQGLMLPLLAFTFWGMFSGWWQATQRTIVLVAAASIVILPWTVRNALAFDAFIPISANDGYNLYIGHNPDSTGRYVQPYALWAMQPGISFAQREALFSRESRKMAIEYALGHPIREAQLSAKKLYYLVTPDSDSLVWANHGPTPIAPHWLLNVLSWLADGYYWALVLLASVGFIKYRRLKLVSFLGLVFVLWGMFHIVFFGEPRFHIPLMPVLALLAALGVREVHIFLFGGAEPAAA